ncbi:MAG: S1 RNA-binding domain-containing protein [Nanoarchaeota archaeon]
MEFRQGDLVLCTVKKIEGTTVFVDVENNHSGSLVLSEIAAGRIRNLREYVSVGKKIACKILKITPDHFELSLRRVTSKEKEIVFDRHKKEAAFRNILKIIGEDFNSVIAKIMEKYNIADFIEEARENSKILENYFSKENSEKLSKLLVEKDEKEKEVKTKFILRAITQPDGLNIIKEVLNFDNIEIFYLGSGNFSITVKAKDFKEANNKMNNALEEITSRAKKRKAHFEILK